MTRYDLLDARRVIVLAIFEKLDLILRLDNFVCEL